MSIQFSCKNPSSSVRSIPPPGPSRELDVELHDHNGGLSVLSHRPLDRPEEVPSYKHLRGPLRAKGLAVGENAVFGDQLHLLQ